MIQFGYELIEILEFSDLNIRVHIRYLPYFEYSIKNQT